jgi:lipopolysaccharide/colanic/teichoic acid biosynthesis glycosyltransferase
MGINDLTLVKLGLEGAHKTTLLTRLLSQVVRMRFQVLAGLTFAVIVPSIIGDLRIGEDPLDKALVEHFDTSMLATTMAFILGFLIFRKVTAFPGVRASAYIFASFAVAYAIAALYFMLLRTPVSFVQLGISFVSTLVLYYSMFFVVPLARRPELWVIPAGDLRWLGHIDNVQWRLIASPAEGQNSAAPVVVDLRNTLSPDWERFITDCALAGRSIYNAKDVAESMTGRVLIDHLSENTFSSTGPSAIYGPLKRYVDFAMAFIAVLVLAPLLLLVAILVRAGSPGPALFKQQRMGYRGHTFTIYKFRTMRPLTDAERSSGTAFMVHDEQRITGLGKFLRKWRIDELPQIINILRGEMSWIGPRPEAIELSRSYEANLSFYRYRHIVRPGLTGWAQINQGHVVGVAQADMKLQYDFFYVKHFSLWLDVLVVLKTIRVILTGFGSR